MLHTPLDTSLLEASAGTGKTYAITTLVARLMLERNIPLREQLVVTFTNAATAELKDRIRGRLASLTAVLTRGTLQTQQERDDALAVALLERRSEGRPWLQQLSAALRGFDEASIFTIHGFCQRMLQSLAFESGMALRAELASNNASLLEEIVYDYWASRLYDAPAEVVRFGLAHGLKPEQLRPIAALGASDPSLVVLPQASAPELQGALLERNTAWREARALWHAERTTVPLILTSAGLDERSYRKGAIAGWVVQMDSLFATDEPSGGTLFPHFARFTTDALRKATKAGNVPAADPFFDACSRLSHATNRVNDALQLWLVAFRRGLVDYARRELIRRKELSRTLDYDDLLLRLDAALAGPDGAALVQAIRAKYRAALVDEFQDTDPVQYRIFRTIFPPIRRGPGMLFLIGDPKQAIYSFRGADVFAYVEAARDMGEARYTLAVNYRSDPTVVKAIHAVFAHPSRPFLLDAIPFPTVGSPPDAVPRLLDADNSPLAGLRMLFVQKGDAAKPRTKGWANQVLPRAVAADISRLLASGACLPEGPVCPGDVAVLVKTNRQAAEMQWALRTLRIPTVLRGDASVFDAPEALEVEEVLAALASPSHASALRLALSTSFFGLGATELLFLKDDEQEWDRIPSFPHGASGGSNKILF
jgi:exodeoxyribonuclease V beta subunit